MEEKVQGNGAKKICPRCGHAFECVTADNCWCDDEVPLSRDMLKKIRVTYLDCLCKECIKFYAELDRLSN